MKRNGWQRHNALPGTQRWFARARTVWAIAAVITLMVIVSVVVTRGDFIGHHTTPPSAQPAPSSGNTAVSPAPSMMSPPPDSKSNGSATLDTEFAQLKNKLHARIGIAIGAVGAGQTPITLGDWGAGPAWSTSKVPLAITALREENPPRVTDAIRLAITESDNAAAESIWDGLGDPGSAAHKVQDILIQTGDPTIVESQKVRPEFTAFGQTIWSLTDQVRFTSVAVCDSRNDPIFALMGQIEHDQSWGIGQIPDTQFKGGWGPSRAGKYLVRQIGVLTAPSGRIAVAIAAEPESGSFADGTQDLTEMGNWLAAHMAELPAGHCHH